MKKYLLLTFFLVSVTHSKSFEGLDLLSGKDIKKTFDEKKYLVAYFLSSSCPCSQAHFDHLNELQKKYKNFNFIGFHSNKQAWVLWTALQGLFEKSAPASGHNWCQMLTRAELNRWMCFLS